MSIAIHVTEAAHADERFAAGELREFLGRLTREPVSGGGAAEPAAGAPDVVIALGRAAECLFPELPPLDERELHVKAARDPAGRTVVALRGGSPRAVRDAAYRFLEECGVLFDLMDDYLPEPVDKLEIRNCDIRETPLIKLHGPHLWINFPMDPSAYSREQWMRYVLGCVRLRFTVLGFHFYNGFPWFDYELDGKRRQDGYFFYRHRHPLPDEPELRYAIHNAKTFAPPETESFVEDGPALHAWAQETLRRVMAETHKFGIKNSVTFEPFAGADKESQRETAFRSLKAIVETYPDLDIVKLVSGEGHSKPGTDEELAQAVREFLGGDLTGTDGREVSLPFGKRWWGDTSAVGVVLDALQSARYAYETVLRARREGVIRPGLEIAIGGYPGCVDALPAIFALIGKVVPDPEIKIHFLPAHGMLKTAQSLEQTPSGMFAGRKLEISGWTEYDGAMYYPQSTIQAVARMRDVLPSQPIEALYAIHWRVAGTTFSTAFFSRCLWSRELTPARFWQDQERLLGREGATDLRAAHEQMEAQADQHGTGTAGFCYYRCWGPALTGADGKPPAGSPFGSSLMNQIYRDLYERLAHRVEMAMRSVTGGAGRRLAGYLLNKVQCAQIHLDYSRLGHILYETGRGFVNPSAPTEVELAWARRVAQSMVEKSREYLRHYQQWMFDRGDEGMLVSYYMTATRYAWRYAHPEEDDATGRFCDLPASECARLRGTAAQAKAVDAAIHAPEQQGQ